MTDDEMELPPPSPWAYAYEWDAPGATKNFDARLINGRACDRQVPVYTAGQLRAYGRACVAAALARADRGKPAETE